MNLRQFMKQNIPPPNVFAILAHAKVIQHSAHKAIFGSPPNPPQSPPVPSSCFSSFSISLLCPSSFFGEAGMVQQGDRKALPHPPPPPVTDLAKWHQITPSYFRICTIGGWCQDCSAAGQCKLECSFLSNKTGDCSCIRWCPSLIPTISPWGSSWMHIVRVNRWSPTLRTLNSAPQVGKMMYFSMGLWLVEELQAHIIPSWELWLR